MTFARIDDVVAGFQAAGRDAKAAEAAANAASSAASQADSKASNAQAVATSAQRAAGLTPMDFGAVGDGVADDTAAVLAAVQYSGTLDWLDKTYRITAPVSASLTGPCVWKSRGAKIVLDIATSVSRAVSVNVAGFLLVIEGPKFEVDAGAKAYTAIRISNDTAAARPDLTATGLVARNARRASTTFPGGDGIYVTGQFNKVTLIRPEAHDCRMAAGAWVSGSQGIFGITVAMTGSRYAKHIVIRDARCSNIWDEDAANVADQDGIRIFQEITDPDASCLIDGYVCENVTNRMVKLHSAPNATVQNVWRILDAAVVPQTVNPNNPDIDAQQAPATVRNVWVHYKGRCHTQIVNASSDRGDYYYSGSLVDGISGIIEDLPGNTITVARVTTAAASSKHRTQVRNINLIGPVATAVSINLTGTGANFASVSGIMGEITGAAITTTGAGTGSLHVQASDIVNTGAAVPLSSGFTGSRTISANGLRGFATGTTPGEFGAIGNGIADDTDAMTAALNAGGLINGEGKTFKINGTVNIPSGLELSDCTLDFSGAPLGTSQSGLRAVASNETARTMTADAVAGSNTIACSTTGLVPGDVLLIQSSRVWSDDGADVVTTGETVAVAGVSTGSVTIYPALSDTYSLAQGATVRRIGGVKGIRLRRVRIIGPGEETLTYGCFFARGVDIKLEQCSIEKFGAAGAAFDTCYDFEVSGSTVKEAYGAGLGYGVVCLSACRNYRIIGNLFQRGRTGWTHGGTSGVGRDIVVANNNCLGQFTAALGTKNAADGITITGNTCVADGGSVGLQDGIRVRGRNAVVQGNYLSGYSRYSIAMILYGQSVPSTLKTAVVANNTIKGARDIGIYVDNLADGDAGNVAITGNNIDHLPGLATSSKGAIHVRSSFGMKNVNIIGNNIADCPLNPVDVRTAGSGTIANLNVTQNVLERTAAGVAAGRQSVITSGVTNATTTPNVTV